MDTRDNTKCQGTRYPSKKHEAGGTKSDSCMIRAPLNLQFLEKQTLSRWAIVLMPRRLPRAAGAAMPALRSLRMNTHANEAHERTLTTCSGAHLRATECVLSQRENGDQKSSSCGRPGGVLSRLDQAHRGSRPARAAPTRPLSTRQRPTYFRRSLSCNFAVFEPMGEKRNTANHPGSSVL